jgi:hypothetical protein
VKEGGVGRLLHRRELPAIDNQTATRLNRDTLYSTAVLDLDAGSATITMPDPGKRFISLQITNEDYYVRGLYYGAGTHTLTRKNVGTRYALIEIRTFVDPNDPKDMERVHALQNSIQIEQKDTGAFEIPNWDQKSRKDIQDALVVLNNYTGDFAHAFGAKGEIDPIGHLIGAATGLSGNSEQDLIYLNITPAQNDGTTVYRLHVNDVPVRAFWSISIYNAQGYFEKNPYNAYTVSDITAKKNADGSIDVQFGACDGKLANCLPITEGWKYVVRLYRPRSQILNGKWHFPAARRE